MSTIYALYTFSRVENVMKQNESPDVLRVYNHEHHAIGEIKQKLMKFITSAPNHLINCEYRESAVVYVANCRNFFEITKCVDFFCRDKDGKPHFAWALIPMQIQSIN